MESWTTKPFWSFTAKQRWNETLFTPSMQGWALAPTADGVHIGAFSLAAQMTSFQISSLSLETWITPDELRGANLC